MYCIKCGAKLEDGQIVCPICETRVYHPDLPIKDEPTYPRIPFKSEEYNRRGVMLIISVVFFLLFVIPVMLELNWHANISWSGYSAIGVLIFYNSFIMPLWFKKPNPVIFTPISFALVLGLLLFICLKTGGNWFMPFAFPAIGALGIIVTAATTVLYYVKKGCLYTVGGMLIALGLWIVFLEYDIHSTFGVTHAFHWSLAPFTVLSVSGILLILIAIIKPLKETLHRIFFIGKVRY